MTTDSNGWPTDVKTWLEKYYGQLKGYTIVNVMISEDDGDLWPQLILDREGKKLTIEVSKDAEGSGPGFLFGIPEPWEEVGD